MNPNMNMMPMSGPQMMQVMQSSPSGPPGPVQHQQQQQPQPLQQQQQAEKLDNISRVKSLLGPLRESMFLTIRSSAFTLQQNNLADNLKRDTGAHHVPRFDKHLEDFYACCDQIEIHLKTAMQCLQQQNSSNHYLPGPVTPMRMETFMPDNAGPIPYPTYLNTVRVHVQSAKDIHDTLISAAQNISQAD
ncbi:mediator of RNA polymerase II transcription subunit 29 [Drosophila suzukii]|uniref:Mediator of RNA polymerase II transcription subunit 29 n=1 Tax=Drosophila suzukii TaxID=28584 RepID=A0AB39Z725_DROSZ|nr:mediator of RNA polymerase II transcription subunit 29 [Drosophila suzukii]